MGAFPALALTGLAAFPALALTGLGALTVLFLSHKFPPQALPGLGGGRRGSREGTFVAEER